MTFEEFRTWFTEFDSTLGNTPPTLAQWWELKARLDVTVEDPASSPPAVQPQPLEPQADDLEPLERELDDDNDKDGGVTRAVVRALRAQQKDLRPARGTRTPL